MVEDDLKDENETEVAVEALVYPATAADDEQRRAFVIETLASAADLASYDPHALIRAINLLVEWLRTGEVPQKDEPRKKATLTPVKT